MSDYSGQGSQRSGASTALIIVGILVGVCCFALLGLGGALFFFVGGSGQIGGTTISYGQTVTGRLGASNPEDRWIFQGRAGEYVIISMESTDNFLDSYLVLLDPSGNEIARDDDGGDGLNSLISITLPSSGNFTIIASPFGSSFGGYRLIVR